MLLGNVNQVEAGHFSNLSAYVSVGYIPVESIERHGF